MSRARLERSALFARKAPPAVGARFETQGWTWRDAEAAAEDARHLPTPRHGGYDANAAAAAPAALHTAATALRRTPSTTPLPPPTNEEIAFLS